MILQKDLMPHEALTGYSVVDADGIVNLENFKAIISNKLSELGINVEIADEQIKSGSILKPSYQDCVVITNSEHSTDYFKYVITMRRQGNVSFMDTYFYGISKLLSEEYLNEQRRANGGLLGKVISAFSSVDQVAIENEKSYYSIVNGCIGELVK